MTPSRDPDLVAAALAATLGLSTIPGGGFELGGFALRAIGVGWATVDLDRAAQESRDHGPFASAPPDRLLGATSRIGPASSGTADRSGPAVVLLEPSTEGRLAAILARRGEGWAALYVGLVPAAGSAAAHPDTIAAGLDRAGRAVRRGSGPLGAALLVDDPRPRSPGGGSGAGSRSALIVVLAGEGQAPDPGGRGSSGDGVPSGP